VRGLYGPRQFVQAGGEEMGIPRNAKRFVLLLAVLVLVCVSMVQGERTITYQGEIWWELPWGEGCGWSIGQDGGKWGPPAAACGNDRFFLLDQAHHRLLIKELTSPGNTGTALALPVTGAPFYSDLALTGDLLVVWDGRGRQLITLNEAGAVLSRDDVGSTKETIAISGEALAAGRRPREIVLRRTLIEASGYQHQLFKFKIGDQPQYFFSVAYHKDAGIGQIGLADGGLGVARDGSIYLEGALLPGAECYVQEVTVVDAAGRLGRTLQLPISVPAQENGLAPDVRLVGLDEQGVIYLHVMPRRGTQTWVARYDAHGRYLGSITSPASEPGINLLEQCWVSAKGDVFVAVADQTAYRIMRFQAQKHWQWHLRSRK
jgi:hypothetical protein